VESGTSRSRTIGPSPQSSSSSQVLVNLVEGVAKEKPVSLLVVVIGKNSDPALRRTLESVRASGIEGAASVVIDTDISVLGTRRSMAEMVNDAVREKNPRFFCVVRGATLFSQGALRSVVENFASTTQPDMIFGNAKIGRGFRKQESVLRPAYAPERLRCQLYFGDAIFFRTSAAETVGLFRADCDGAEIYDLVLALAGAGSVVSRLKIPILEIAAERRDLSYEGLSGVRRDVYERSIRDALSRYLLQTGGGTIDSVGTNGVHVTRRPVVGNPLVSIVIPTRALFEDSSEGSRSFLLDAVRSITKHSTYKSLEFVIVVDKVAEPDIIAELRSLLADKLVIVEWDKPFNFSDKVNLGAVHASGDYFLILNDDVEIISPGWIEAMLSLGQRPRAGMVGAMLYYEDDTIQHAGHAYYRGEASHVGLDLPRGSMGPLCGFKVEREIAGVTAACALMPRAVYFEAGGFSGLLPGNFNDVDLCMKVTSLGYEIFWTPHAELYHFESKTRDATVHAFEVDRAWGRWGNRLVDDEHWPYPLSREPEQWISAD
jgi:glycosyltransferase involved in cell wall biosynthesis